MLLLNESLAAKAYNKFEGIQSLSNDHSFDSYSVVYIFMITLRVNDVTDDVINESYSIYLKIANL